MNKEKPQLLRKFFEPTTELKLEEKTAIATITTNGKDRHGDIVVTEGIDTKNFMSNPVVLWAHNYNEPPIGTVKEIIRENGKLKAVVKFGDTPQANGVYNLMRDGILKTWSIGFKPIDWMPIENEYGYKINQSELIELSVVSVPANPDALTEMIKSFDVKPNSFVLSKKENNQMLTEMKKNFTDPSFILEMLEQNKSIEEAKSIWSERQLKSFEQKNKEYEVKIAELEKVLAEKEAVIASLKSVEGVHEPLKTNLDTQKVENKDALISKLMSEKGISYFDALKIAHKGDK